MSAADLHRFLGVCALVSDLYCPGYNPRQPLAKDSNLARTAARYKLDVTKMPGTVRAELTKRKETQARTKNRKRSFSAPSGRHEPSKVKPTKTK
jgi:hypothetical protein